MAPNLVRGAPAVLLRRRVRLLGSLARMEPEPQPPAPAVVAVVVTCDPGWWFEEALTSLATQDYPNLSVLVIDSASEEDPTSRVAEVIPGAFVMRLETRLG